MENTEVKTEEVVEEVVAEEKVETKAETKTEAKPKKEFSKRPARKFDKAQKEFDERVVQINRISKTVKGGRRMRFAAIVVCGDKKGRVGYGLGKAAEVPDAIRKASEAARKNVTRIPLVDGYRTIPHETIGRYGAGQVVLRPAAEGTGIVAGGVVRAILELSGATDVITKCVGSRTPINQVHATMKALTELKTVNSVAKLRGLKVEELR